jgi:hypothetical protein
MCVWDNPLATLRKVRPSSLLTIVSGDSGVCLTQVWLTCALGGTKFSLTSVICWHERLWRERLCGDRITVRPLRCICVCPNTGSLWDFCANVCL